MSPGRVDDPLQALIHRPKNRYPRFMVDSNLLATLELLTPGEQQALLAVAHYLKGREGRSVIPVPDAESLLAGLSQDEPAFSPPDNDVSPARQAARRFMPEHPVLMRLLAK